MAYINTFLPKKLKGVANVNTFLPKKLKILASLPIPLKILLSSIEYK